MNNIVVEHYTQEYIENCVIEEMSDESVLNEVNDSVLRILRAQYK